METDERRDGPRAGDWCQEDLLLRRGLRLLHLDGALVEEVRLFDRITWTSFQSLSQPPAPLTWEELDRAAYLDDGRGVLYGGFYAFQLLTLRLFP